MNSILNLFSPLIIFMLSHLNSQAAVIWVAHSNSHSLGVESWDLNLNAKIAPPPMTQKTACGDYSRGWFPIVLYSWWDIWAVKLLWHVWAHPFLHTIMLRNVGTLLPKLSPPMIQQSAWGNHFIAWIPISTWSHHGLYSWWDIETGKLLWNGRTDPNPHPTQ